MAEALAPFIGEILQVPPAYSAIKVDGERAYDLARAGEAVDLAPRPVRIIDLRVAEADDPDHVTLEAKCGKGTYVRAIVRDLAEALGACGHVSALRRTRVGPFDDTASVTLEMLEQLGYEARQSEALLPVEDRAGRHPGAGRDRRRTPSGWQAGKTHRSRSPTGRKRSRPA